MRSLLLTAMLVLCSCSAEQRTPAQTRETVIPDHSLAAFGGHLLGTDHGEWIGKLMFQDADDNLETILNENVHCIVKNSNGIFALTGLAHLGANEGYIFVITRKPGGCWDAFLGRPHVSANRNPKVSHSFWSTPALAAIVHYSTAIS